MNDPILDIESLDARANLADVSGIRMAVDYGDPAAEYAAAVTGAAIYDARGRGLIEVTGCDRADWLNHLITNTIKNLRPGEGNYTFATDAKGRILLDFNMLALSDAIWLDIDHRIMKKAMTHFDKHLIVEDVTLRDRSDDWSRIVLLGPKALGIAEALGATRAATMGPLESVSVSLLQKHRLLVRHDFAGVFGAELYVRSEDAVGCWNRLLEIGMPAHLTPIGRAGVHTLRIEAGIPLHGEDIDEEVLPAETRQIERGISHAKGCYLGQEVIERMRSRGSLARQLVGLRFDGERLPEVPAALRSGEADAGRVTSVCRSYALDTLIGLGYVKTAYAQPGTAVSIAEDSQITGEVVPLPFRQPAGR
jgi:folate-binding protein YgfZ